MTARDTIHDRDSALAFLLGRIDYERTRKVPYRSRDFKLDRMRELMARLGHPESGYPAVHIAGTKGKGSTAVMVAAGLQAAGYRTGLYTSPHLERLEERFLVDGQPCSCQDLVQLLARIEPEVCDMDQEASADGGRPGPTYFEITTAAALLYFQQRQVACAVLEVGLGGRLDSTNVCQPAISIITSISYDHTRQLGNTLSSIAREKAGIIRPGIPVVSGVEQQEPLQVIKAVAAENQSRLLNLGQDFHFRHPAEARSTSVDPVAVTDQPNCFDYREMVDGRSRELLGVTIPMLGRHQAANASVAIAALNQLHRDGWALDQQHLRAGFAHAQSPARIEIAGRQPTIVLDAAHNLASILALLDVLKEWTTSGQRVLVFSTSVDKDARGMLVELLPHFDRVILTRYLNNPRAVDPATLVQLCESCLAQQARAVPLLQVCPDPESAWQAVASVMSPADLVCVTGSFFLAAEIRHHIEATRGRPHVSRSC